jgi:hypothetical protein
MSAIFYLPHFVWHNWECGTMEKLLKDIGMEKNVVEIKIFLKIYNFSHQILNVIKENIYFSISIPKLHTFLKNCHR